MTEPEEPCTRCARVSIRQALLDWVTVISIVIEVLQGIQ